MSRHRGLGIRGRELEPGLPAPHSPRRSSWGMLTPASPSPLHLLPTAIRPQQTTTALLETWAAEPSYPPTSPKHTSAAPQSFASRPRSLPWLNLDCVSINHNSPLCLDTFPPMYEESLMTLRSQRFFVLLWVFLFYHCFLDLFQGVFSRTFHRLVLSGVVESLKSLQW